MPVPISWLAPYHLEARVARPAVVPIRKPVRPAVESMKEVMQSPMLPNLPNSPDVAVGPVALLAEARGVGAPRVRDDIVWFKKDDQYVRATTLYSDSEVRCPDG